MPKDGLHRQLEVTQQKVTLLEGEAHDAAALREEVRRLELDRETLKKDREAVAANSAALKAAVEGAENDKSVLLDHLQVPTFLQMSDVLELSNTIHGLINRLN
jgi:hypothetical protein